MKTRLSSMDPKTALPLGMLISNYGNGMYLLAISVLLYNSDSGVSKFAGLLIAQTLGSLVMQFFASTAADDGYAKKLALNAELIRALLVTTGALLATLGFVDALIAVGFALSLIQPFFRTSIFKIGPLIAHEHGLARYNAKVATFQQVGMFFGAATAGALMLITPTLPLWINGLSYFFSAASVAVSQVPHQVDFAYSISWLKTVFSTKNAFLKWRDMARAVMKAPYIVVLALVTTADLTIVNFINLSYPVLLDAEGLSTEWISYWDTLFAVGAIIGANIYGWIKRFHEIAWLPAVFLTAELLLLILMARHGKVAILAVLFLIGIANAISISSLSYQLQTEIAAEFVGRVAGIRQLFLTAVSVSFLPLLSRGLNTGVSEGVMRISVFTAIALGIFILTTTIRHMRNRDDKAN